MRRSFFAFGLLATVSFVTGQVAVGQVVVLNEGPPLDDNHRMAATTSRFSRPT